MFKIQVKPQYRKIVSHVTEDGFIRTPSKKTLLLDSRTKAEQVRMHIVKTAFPQAKSKQSAAYTMFKIVQVKKRR